MAKMRATLRKAAQVTPPPSPKNAMEDGKGHWLRNHSTPKSAVRATTQARRNGKRPRIKKENSFIVHNDDSVNGRCSRSSTSSPICNGRIRTRSTSEAQHTSNFWGPRRSARLIGIPPELDTEDDEGDEEEDDDDEEVEDEEDAEEEEEEEGQEKSAEQRIGRNNRSCRRSKASINGLSHISEVSSSVDGEEDESMSNPSSAKKQQSRSTPSPVLDLSNGVCSDDPSIDTPTKVDTSDPVTPCKECKQRKKGRTINALLVESERYLQYPSGGSGRTSGCRQRSTYNSRQDLCFSVLVREDEEDSSKSPNSSLPIPQSVDQVQFSFELVPSGTCWYQTFLRDEAQHGAEPLPNSPPGVSFGPAPFLLPYEMSLDAILRTGRTERKKKISVTGVRKGTRKASAALQSDFRPIISTRLQMQSAARLQKSQQAAATEAQMSHRKSESNQIKKTERRSGKSLWHLPRKSPRCHASTLAILSSTKSDEEDSCVPGPSNNAKLSPVKEEREEIDEGEDEDETANGPDPELVRTLEEMLTHDLERKVVQPDPTKKKRGRPRKYPLPEETVIADGPLTDLLATPLDRIEDIVDEQLLLENQQEIVFEDAPDYFPEESDSQRPHQSKNEKIRPSPAHEVDDVFHDLDSNSGEAGSRSSSIYETASEIGSNGSTGTCDSRTRKWRRRKRPNMTGWPRSVKKKSRPLPLVLEPDDDDSGLPPAVLSPIREESHNNSSGVSGESPSRRSVGSYVSKPFQFQRKTLRFCGKRILRPAAQRHAPQRLEYWPCFESINRRRIKKGRKA